MGISQAGTARGGLGDPQAARMKSKYFYFALLLVCIHARDTAEVASLSDEDLGAGMYAAKDHVEGEHRLEYKVDENNELDGMVSHLKHDRRNERTHKAQAAVRYMEDYRAKKAHFMQEGARLRNRMQKDKQILMKHNRKAIRTNERRKKHHRATHRLWKSSIKAMGAVDHMIHPHVFEDPTVKTAKRAINKAHKNEIYTVLGLDRYQLGHDYLLKMDAAVSEYEARPSAKAQEVLKKSLEVTKEKMTKEKKLKRMHADERHSKHVRDQQNQKYFAIKWHEKKNELDQKKRVRNKFVHELNVKDKHAAWVRRKKEDEKARKATRVRNEKNKKKASEAGRKELKAKKLNKKAYAEKQQKRKFATTQRNLDKKVVAKSSDYLKALKQMKLAKEKQAKEVANQKRIVINQGYAKKAQKSAAKNAGKTKAALAAMASELNNKRVKSAGAFLRHRITKVREVGFKAKAAANKRKSYAAQYAKAKIRVKATLRAKMKAKKAAAYHKKGLSTRRRRL